MGWDVWGVWECVGRGVGVDVCLWGVFGGVCVECVCVCFDEILETFNAVYYLKFRKW